STEFAKLDTTTGLLGAWSSAGASPQAARYHHGGAVSGNIFYTLGGLDSQGVLLPTVSVTCASTTTGSITLCSGGTGPVWADTTALPSARQEAAGAAYTN